MGKDFLKGDSGDDVLVGGNGADTLVGSTGADTLTGGNGPDTFEYRKVTDGGDLITDFENNDKIDLSQLLAQVGYTGSDPFTDGYLGLSEKNGNTLVTFDADGSGGPKSATDLVTLEGFTGNPTFIFA